MYTFLQEAKVRRARPKGALGFSKVINIALILAYLLFVPTGSVPSVLANQGEWVEFPGNVQADEPTPEDISQEIYSIFLPIILNGNAEVTGPSLDVTGLVADDELMRGDIASGYLLEVKENASVDHSIQFAEGTEADRELEDAYFGLYLVESTVSDTELTEFYKNSGIKQPLLGFYYGVVAGTNPYVYIDGGTIRLVDAGTKYISGTDIDMQVPDDFPLGTYIFEGEIIGLDEEVGTVRLTLVVDLELVYALSLVQAGTTLTGTLADLTAEFPGSIPQVVVDQPFKINSRMTLGAALPLGTTVSILLTVDGVGPIPYVTDALIPSTQFWITDLLPESVAADFDADYAGHVEVYAITIDSGGGNPLEIDTNVKIESIISNDGFITNWVLADIILPVYIPPDEEAAQTYVQSNTSLGGSLDLLTTTFPTAIPPVLVDEDYLIDYRLTLGQELPEGTKISITQVVNDGTTVSLVVDKAFEPGTVFRLSVLSGLDAPGFNAEYSGRVEEYSINITSGDGNPLEIDTTLKIEAIISKNAFITDTVLDDVLLSIYIPPDELAAISLVQDGTTLDGTLASLVATYPESIPPILFDDLYKIDMLFSLGQALPAGSTISITLAVNGGAVVTHVAETTIPSTIFWLRDLGVEAALFDGSYAARTEVYAITIKGGGGNPDPIITTLTVDAFISKNDFGTIYLLAGKTMDLTIPADEAAALLEVQNDTTLVGTIGNLTVTYPTSIPAIIVDEPYAIDYKMKLGTTLPTGTTITITRADDGGLPEGIVTSVPVPGLEFKLSDITGQTAASFDSDYNGKEEVYAIIFVGGGGNVLEISTTLTFEPVISKDGFTTTTVILGTIELDVLIPADEDAALVQVQDQTILSGTLDSFTVTYPSSIPPVLVTEPYMIDYWLTLGEALPAGTTINITRAIGSETPVEIVSDIVVSGTEFWLSSLDGPARTDFDTNYAGRIETYTITFTSSGNVDEILTTLTFEPVISKNGFTTEVSLGSIVLDVILPADEAAALTQVQAETTITEDLGNFSVTYPSSIPTILITLGYKIDYKLTLGEALPAGSTITITRTVDSVATNLVIDIAFEPGTEFWLSALASTTRDVFNESFAGLVELYTITVTGGGGNALPIETTLKFEPIISKDSFSTNVILETASINLVIPADEEAAAVVFLQENTTLSGTTLDLLTATFPSSIPQVIIDAPYKINSRMTLAEPLPDGTTVSITLSVNGNPPVPYVTDVLLPSSPFWVTELLPGSVAADFYGGYANRVEVYSITINSGGGNPEPINTTVKIESIISKDGFGTQVVLADATLPVSIPADEEATALLQVQDETTMSGTLDALKVTYPTTIPQIILDAGYQINNKLILKDAVPGDLTVSIEISYDGLSYSVIANDFLVPGQEFWISDVLTTYGPFVFGANYNGKVEFYRISFQDSSEPVNTEVTFQTVISKDNFVTQVVLAEITLPVVYPPE